MANLSAKEAMFIGDYLASEQVLVSKYRAMSGQCADATIRTKLEQIASKHQQHYDRISNYLK